MIILLEIVMVLYSSSNMERMALILRRISFYRNTVSYRTIIMLTLLNTNLRICHPF